MEDTKTVLKLNCREVLSRELLFPLPLTVNVNSNVSAPNFSDYFNEFSVLSR